MVEYLTKIKGFFSKESISAFSKKEKTRWDSGELSGKKTTKTFFDKLINMRWNSQRDDLPSNPNWARRIQDIKEFGYTLATHTSLGGNGTHIMLLPIPKGGATGYEVMSDAFKKRTIKLLDSTNVYEFSKKSSHSLIPDHKFPEIRWDENTRVSNEGLDNEEIIAKFQLIDNQRNQQKREVCRRCFQTNKRGIIYGIDYFYNGNNVWPQDVPKRGKDAENGCIGCAWYDIEMWRNALNKLLNKD